MSSPLRPDGIASPHRRFNALTGEWVLVSAERTQRPWLGSEEEAMPTRRPTYDPTCHLCPGNTRAGGDHNPTYVDTFVFTNDFAALRPDIADERAVSGLLVAQSERGTCRVISYSPRHDLDMAAMSIPDIERVIHTWCDQTLELSRKYPWVQIFENRGPQMGASNPHPHGQVWATSHLPVEATKEVAAQRAYKETHTAPLLLDYVRQEADSSRVVAAYDRWVAVVPFWAVWPFELLIVPLRHVPTMPELTAYERTELARLLSDVLGRYDRVFDHPFPYSLGWHGAPVGGGSEDYWQLHAHVYPPLLRSATVRKHMVGYELLSESQRDLTPEDAAARLCSLSPVVSDA